MQEMNEPKKLGFAGRIAELFLRNRELSVLTIIVLAAWGALSFVLTPKQYNPDIVAPAFSIVTEFPNASATEVYEFVTRPMEDRLSELPAVDEITSESIPGGRSVVTVKFDIGSDREAAKVTLNQKLRDNINLKPVGALEPVIVSIDPDDVAILDIALASEILSESSLRKLAHDLADELKLVPDVSRVELKGGRVNHLQVELDAEKLAVYGLSVDRIEAEIASANAVFTIGTLEGDTRNPVVNISGNIENADELRNLVVARDGDAFVRLGDVAAISYDPGEITNHVRLADRENDTPVVHVALSKLPGTNATTVSRAVLAKAEELEARIIPDGVTLSVLRDEGRTASEEIRKLTGNLVTSIAIVGVILYAFLGFRNAIVVALAIPLTLLAVFAAGLLSGETINRITLFALILSLGLLVDSATVVVENINRFLRERPDGDRIRTIAEAVDEVGMGLVMSTVTTLFAFFPMAFVTGMMGPYMGPIPFFVPAALIASLLIAFTINPFLASVFSGRRATTREAQPKENAFTRSVHRIESSYASLLSQLLERSRLRKRVLIGALILLLISLALPATGTVPFRMLPKADKEQFSVYLDLPQGTDVSRTETVSRAVSEDLLSDRSVEYIARFVGESQVIDFNGLFKGSGARTGEHQATVKVGLTHPDERSETSEDIATRVRASLENVVRTYPDLTVQIVEDPPGPPVLATFLVSVKGPDEAVREMIATDFERVARGIEGVVDIETTVPERGIHHVYRVRTDKAELLGVAQATIASTLQTALSGSSVGLFHGSETGARKAEQEYILVRFAEDSRDETGDLTGIRLPSASGVAVPLSELIEEVTETIEYPIATDNRRPVTHVSAEMEGRSVIYGVLDLFPTLLSYELPGGSRLVSWSPLYAEYESMETGERYRVELGGEWELTLEVFRDLGIAMGVAIFLIYFVLVGQFRSLRIPLLVMATIPLALVGVLPGFAILYALKGTYFNATSMIGVIALAGIVVNNAIIYLEYLSELRQKRLPIGEALVTAGRTRLLPIILTSVTTILGSLTIVSDPVWEGLAWAVIFGLSVSTFLTLVIFPLLYFTFERRKW